MAVSLYVKTRASLLIVLNGALYWLGVLVDAHLVHCRIVHHDRQAVDEAFFGDGFGLGDAGPGRVGLLGLGDRDLSCWRSRRIELLRYSADERSGNQSAWGGFIVFSCSGWFALPANCILAVVLSPEIIRLLSEMRKCVDERRIGNLHQSAEWSVELENQVDCSGHREGRQH